MQILYFEDETEKKLRAENLKVKAENEELRNENKEKELQIYHLQKELNELKRKSTKMDKAALEDCFNYINKRFRESF